MKIRILKMGCVEYGQALQIQEKLMGLRKNGLIDDTLLLLEHKPVLTLGRRGNVENILLSRDELEKQGIDIFDVTRGGDVTYHGPGQIVGYPIMDLNYWGRDIKDFVWKIQEAVISLLKENYNINAGRDDKKYTGVWVDDRKIMAIGIAVKSWVTMHGFAFNVNTDLSHFKWINPCGILDKGVTSLQAELGEGQNMDVLFNQVANYFCKAFEAERVDIDTENMYI